MTPDEQQIRELVARWHEASRAGDVDAVLALMTDDACFLVAGRPGPMDRATFEALSRPAPGQPAPAFESEQEIHEIECSGDLAFLRSTVTVRLTPPGATAAVLRSGPVLSVFRRGADGRWRLARDANLMTVRTAAPT